MGDRAMAPPTRPANFWAPFRPEIRLLQAVPAHRVQPCPDFAPPITNRATPRLVVHGERPTTDFLGAGAGPMGVCRAANSSLVAASLHHMARVAVAAREVGGVRALVMRLFGAVRTNRSQPRIM